MSPAPRTVLVTGGAGFIGSHVAEGYREAGWQVVVLDNLSTGRRANVPSGVELVEMDLSDGRLPDVFREHGGFELVNHQAAQVDVRVSVTDPRRDARSNIDGLLNVLEAARHFGTRRVVFASSGGVVYGEAERRPTPEQARKQPVSPYGVAKLAGEYYLWAYARVHGLEYAALRYANVYGPRQDPSGEAGVVAILCGRLARGEPLTIYGDGEQTRDYVYVADVARANLLASEAALPEPRSLDDVAFNVGTGEETSVNALAALLQAAVGRSVPVRHEPARPGELRHSALDAAKLRALGWSPGLSREQGLTRTFGALTGADA
ncbi:MAG: NAD-dependent epimerase/dehydratase family protein [Gemmatimonadota bacterium]